MSYTIVKGLSINKKQGKVFWTCGCSNVFPRTQTRQEWEYMSNKLKTEGFEAVEKAILKEYWNGNLHGGSNMYSKTIMARKFDSSEHDKGKIENLEEFLYSLYEQAKTDKQTKGKYVIKLDNNTFLVKSNKRGYTYSHVRCGATVYDNVLDARLNVAKMWKNNNNITKAIIETM